MKSIKDICRFYLSLCLMVVACNLLLATPTITNVVAQQRYPWNGLVDITVVFTGTSNEVEKTECTFVATNNMTAAAIPVDHVTFTGMGPTSEENTWTRHFIWDATADVGEVEIDEVALTATAGLEGVQLWENGPYWAECNVGASKPEEYGYYFWWGDTVGYKRVGSNWNAVDGSKKGFSFVDDNCPTYTRSNSSLQSLGYIDSTGNLAAEHDAATTHLGVPWRMPTGAEMSTMINNCTTTWTTRNGVYGLLVTGKGDYASKSIFLPAAGYGRWSDLYSAGYYGYYWSSTPYSGHTQYSDASDYAWVIADNFIQTGYLRFAGLAVRPLREFIQSTCMTVHMSLDTHMDMRPNAGAIEQIRFSPSWETPANVVMATVTLIMNGLTVTNSTESGVYDWMPTRNGTYTFTHTVMTNGVQVGETLTATFVVEGLNPDMPTISPASGTMFDSSLTVTMACASEGATIYYTTNGVTPTMESPVYKKFRVKGKTTVKAVAFYDDGSASEMAVAEYALGQCEDPVISPADGTVFQHSNQEVSMSCGEEGTIHYTLDGSEPTVESPTYAGPFTISETTTIKAKVFSDRYFDSQIVTSVLTREWVAVATPVITAAASFTGSKTLVSIACATEGATIRYTTNGSDPNSHAKKYTGPFEVTASCTIKAYATLTDYTNSAIATQTIEKIWGIGDSVGVPDQMFTTTGAAGWVRDTEVSQDGSESVRSGKIDDEQSSVLTTVVNGRGTVSFWWKTSCEEDEEEHNWDHVEFAVDGEEVARLDGETDWQQVTYAITTDGDHTLTWTYCKDDVEDAGDDCAWVDTFVWTPVPTDPVPEISATPTAEEIASALAGSADTRLTQYLTDGTEYNAYRAWVNRVAGSTVANRQAVKDSPHAWLSYALDSATLLTEAPQQGDMAIAVFAKGSDEGTYNFQISIEGITVGTGTVPANLATIFSLEGCSTVNGKYEPLDVTFGTPIDGKVTVTAQPTGTSFFIKAKMKP